MRREVDLVDHQQAAALDAGSAFARNFVAARHVDDVNESVHQLRTERRRQIVAAAFDENQFESRMRRLQFGNRLQIHGSVLANRGVRAPSRLDAQHSAGGQRSLANQELGVFLGVDVVRDYAPDSFRGHSRLLRRSTNAVFPQPTGPAIPTRNALMISSFSKKKIPLRERQHRRWLARQQLAVRTNFVGLRIHLDAAASPNCESCRASRSSRQFRTATARFRNDLLFPPSSDAAETNVTAVDAVAPPKDPNIGR